MTPFTQAFSAYLEVRDSLSLRTYKSAVRNFDFGAAVEGVDAKEASTSSDLSTHRFNLPEAFPVVIQSLNISSLDDKISPPLVLISLEAVSFIVVLGLLVYKVLKFRSGFPKGP